MMQKKAKTLSPSRNTALLWGELDSLCRSTRYWLYRRRQKARAQRNADRLDKVLRDLPDNDLAIIRQEGWALLCELRGQIDDAIAHRMHEIQLIEKLHQEARRPGYDEDTRAYMLKGRDSKALQQRRTILEALSKAKSQHSASVFRKAQ